MFVILINPHDRTLRKRELRDWRELVDRKRELGELIGAEYIGIATGSRMATPSGLTMLRDGGDRRRDGGGGMMRLPRTRR
jgi:hypothetical protein